MYFETQLLNNQLDRYEIWKYRPSLLIVSIIAFAIIIYFSEYLPAMFILRWVALVAFIPILYEIWIQIKKSFFLNGVVGTLEITDTHIKIIYRNRQGIYIDIAKDLKFVLLNYTGYKGERIVHKHIDEFINGNENYLLFIFDGKLEEIRFSLDTEKHREYFRKCLNILYRNNITVYEYNAYYNERLFLLNHSLDETKIDKIENEYHINFGNPNWLIQTEAGDTIDFEHFGYTNV